MADEQKIAKCQCCGEVAPLICGPSRFGPETWACYECWNPVTDHHHTPQRRTKMEITDYIEVAAKHAVAQGWCEPEASNKEMDVVLADAISKPVARLAQAWHDTAAQHLRNEEYYRGLVIKIGELLGPEAYISDDGSVQQDVLCAKVPELVAKLVAAYRS